MLASPLVACPFFDPQEPIEPEIPRVSLGVAYQGRCTLDPVCEEVPLPLCNGGYARGLCPRFPQNEAIDAVRFSRLGDGIQWMEESDHRPVRFGTGGKMPENVARLAKAFERSVAAGKVRQ